MARPGSTGRWLLYGAYGFTGELLAEEAVRRGHTPLLAGRDASKLAALGERLGLPTRAFPLSDRHELVRALGEVDAVLLAAGPFSRTARPMLEACLFTDTHYLDITGELNVMQAVFRSHAHARRLGIALITGAGFDVVATDCLAAHVAAGVPEATHLEIGIHALSTPSSGTARSGLGIAARGGLVRRDGELIEVPFGYGGRVVPFPRGAEFGMPVPWADLITAHHSTGIPNITCYLAYPPGAARLARLGAPLAQAVLRAPGARRLLGAAAGLFFRGPSAERMAHSRAEVWARAAGPSGSAEAALETPEAYRFTALAGVRAVERVLSGEMVRRAGALSPAMAFGPDFVLSVPGVTRAELVGS